MMRQGNDKKALLSTLIIASVIIFSLLASSKPGMAVRMDEYRVRSAAYGYDPRPFNLIMAGPPGDMNKYIYFTEEFVGRIGRMDTTILPAVASCEEWVLPSHPILGFAEPWDLDNSTTYIWYTDYHLNRIGRFTPGTPPVDVEYWVIPTAGARPKGIFAKSDFEIWFTESEADKIGVLRPDTGFTEYQLPLGSHPLSILVSGNSVWFTEYLRNKIGVLTVVGTSAVIKEYSLPGGSKPWGIAIDPDGFVWFTASGRNVIGQLNPFTGKVIEHRSVPTDLSEPREIIIDNRTRNVWFTEFQGHRIGKYVPGDNLWFEHPTLTAYSSPHGIALKPSSDGSTTEIFFTEWSANRIGHITEGADRPSYGTTTTITGTVITSGASGVYSAGTATTAVTTQDSGATAFTSTGNTRETYTIAVTNRTSTILSNTAYRLSTSTRGTYTSYIVEVVYTTTTSTSISTTFVSTTSVTSTNVSRTTSTSYTGTTSITYTTTSFPTIYTTTQSLTSTTVATNPGTLTTTFTDTRYRSTTTVPTTVTSTTTAQAFQTALTTTTSTVSATLTTTTVNTTVSPTLPFRCLVASAAYGSEVSPAVQYLRDFRDRLVSSTFAGSSFMSSFNAWYYSFSPVLAGVISDSPSMRIAVRAFLYPLLGILRTATAVFGVLSFNSEVGIVAAGLVASGLLGLFYDAPLLTAILIKLRRRYASSLRLRYLMPIHLSMFVSLVLILTAEILQNSVLMRFSTVTLVLSTMIGVAASVSFLCVNNVGRHLKLRE